MIDSVLKGTGNSRFLKSAVPAGTSWADALAMLQAGTFPIDFNGINTEGFQQVGTPLNKANLLKDATAAQIGLPPSTTPDGMFQALGKTGDLHVWRKTVVTSQEIPAGYTLGSVQTNVEVFSGGSSDQSVLYYDDSPNVDDAGNVTIPNKGGNNQYAFYANGNFNVAYYMRGKYIQIYPGGGYTAIDGVWFVPSDANITVSNYKINVSKIQKVNGYAKTPAGTTTTYPVSTSPNAYQEGDDAKAAGYVVGEVESGQFSLGVTVDSSAINRYNYSSAIAVNDDGTISLLSSSPIEINGGQSAQNNDAMAKIIGKYITLERVGDSNHSPDFDAGTVWFIPADATYGNKGSYPNNINYITKRQPVTGYAVIPAGTTIEYLGKLGDKARVQVVSYVGTGRSGADNPNSLTFDFIPKLLFINNDFESAYYICLTLFGAKLTDTYKPYAFFDAAGNLRYPDSSYARKNGKNIQWYSLRNAYVQANGSGLKYIAIAIG